MALSVLGLALQAGLEITEVGINATSVAVDYMPEWIIKTKNFQNQTVGRILPTLASRLFKIAYEFITGSSTGLTTATFLVDSASLIANDKAEFGSPAGIILLDKATVTQTREGLRSVDMELSSDPLFTAV